MHNSQLLWHSSLVSQFYVKISGLIPHPERYDCIQEGPEGFDSCCRRRQSVTDETENRGNIPPRRKTVSQGIAASMLAK